MEDSIIKAMVETLESDGVVTGDQVKDAVESLCSFCSRFQAIAFHVNDVHKIVNSYDEAITDETAVRWLKLAIEACEAVGRNHGVRAMRFDLTEEVAKLMETQRSGRKLTVQESQAVEEGHMVIDGKGVIL